MKSIHFCGQSFHFLFISGSSLVNPVIRLLRYCLVLDFWLCGVISAWLVGLHWRVWVTPVHLDLIYLDLLLLRLICWPLCNAIGPCFTGGCVPHLLLRLSFHLSPLSVNLSLAALNVPQHLCLAAQATVQPVMRTMPEDAELLSLRRLPTPIEQVPLEAMLRHFVRHIQRTRHVAFGLSSHICVCCHQLSD